MKNTENTIKSVKEQPAILTGVARDNLESKGLVLSNKIGLDLLGTEIPDMYALYIGYKDVETGKLESNLSIDTNNNSIVEFNKVVSLYDKGKLTLLEREMWYKGKKKIVYYVPYDIQESSKNIETEVGNHIERNEYISNGSYKCAYELLLTCNDATRRFVISFSTHQMSMVSLLEVLEDEIESLFDLLEEEKEDEEVYGDANVDENGYLKGIVKLNREAGSMLVGMFNSYSELQNVEIESSTDFLDMIVSILQLKCEYIPDNEEEENKQKSSEKLN